MKIIGNGVYSYTECARILGVTPRRVRGWFLGWSHRTTGPLFVSDYADREGAISFLDLIDAAVAATLNHKHQTPIQTIRKLRKILEKEWRTRHPFARQELFTDESGREVFCEVAFEDGETHLLELLKQQFALRDVVLPFLKTVEYSDVTKFAEVFGLMERVILDPRRKYGKPIVRGTGMPTSILYQCYEATENPEVVAEWYNVDIEDVEQAVAFESSFAGIAA